MKYSTGLLRISATSATERIDLSPFIVARARFVGLWEPSDLVRIFLMPAASQTARTALEAMMPVPVRAGFNTTLQAQNLPITGCRIVPSATSTLAICFLALSVAFLIAGATSEDFAWPMPTFPVPSPTTTQA